MLPNDFKNYNRNTEKSLIVLLNFNIHNYYIKILIIVINLRRCIVMVLLMGFVLGSAFGFVLHRSKYSVSLSFEHLVVDRDFTYFFVLMLTISLQSIGVSLLHYFNLITVLNEQFSVFATALGSFIFGVGIRIAYGCTLSYIRAGEGYTDGIINLAMFLIVAGMTRYGLLQPISKFLKQFFVVESDIPTTLGISGIRVSVMLTVISIIFIIISFKRYHLSNKEKTKYYLVAISIATIALIGWLIGDISGTGRSIEVAGPTSKIMEFLMTGDFSYISWKELFVIGILVSAFFSTKIKGQFYWHKITNLNTQRAVIGGALMGFGAIVAEGCAVGNVLVSTAALSWRGFVSMIFMMFGVQIMTIIRTKQESN